MDQRGNVSICTRRSEKTNGIKRGRVEESIVLKRKRSNDADCDKFEDLLAKYQEIDTQSMKMMKKVPQIVLGRYVIDTWYPSPYPTMFYPENKLYICENCLSYTSTQRFLKHHQANECPRNKNSPPGARIYYEKPSKTADGLALFEIDGKMDTTFAQNLCLLAKLFMDQKTLYFDVALFHFFVLYRHDKDGYHIVGYFSKEKLSPENYNLSCIVILPPYQRHGYGSLLISISYEISKYHGQVGTPERPLSTHGRAAYVEYWKYTILNEISIPKCKLSVEQLSHRTGIMPQDITDVLLSCNIVRSISIVDQCIINGSCRKVQAQYQALRPLRLCNSRLFSWKKSSAKPNGMKS
ncbi:hypothetical protein THRCLA_20270 [Thraustotheca clavata]|uniref:Histone acetyltransferase n=1 Tax=Thraustotheca clavata TaxID=74557 RepID=A0A1W0A9G2_9STRA|nr:hypothetical protein THRCLA_20270 [Thraustotheca clavata]